MGSVMQQEQLATLLHSDCGSSYHSAVDGSSSGGGSTVAPVANGAPIGTVPRLPGKGQPAGASPGYQPAAGPTALDDTTMRLSDVLSAGIPVGAHT